jgi:hypothetical protein
MLPRLESVPIHGAELLALGAALGEDSKSVFKRIVGLSDDQFSDLKDDGWI